MVENLGLMEEGAHREEEALQGVLEGHLPGPQRSQLYCVMILYAQIQKLMLYLTRQMVQVLRSKKTNTLNSLKMQ